MANLLPILFLEDITEVQVTRREVDNFVTQLNEVILSKNRKKNDLWMYLFYKAH